MKVTKTKIKPGDILTMFPELDAAVFMGKGRERVLFLRSSFGLGELEVVAMYYVNFSVATTVIYPAASGTTKEKIEIERIDEDRFEEHMETVLSKGYSVLDEVDISLEDIKSLFLRMKLKFHTDIVDIDELPREEATMKEVYQWGESASEKVKKKWKVKSKIKEVSSMKDKASE